MHTKLQYIKRNIVMKYAEVEKYVLTRLKNELPDNLFYHSLQHTEDVLKNVERLSVSEGIDKDSAILLQTAALFHDFGYIKQYSDNESVGCNYAKEILPGFDYSEDEISRISEMIMATVIPQAPKSIYDEILCDADLDYLGRDDFNDISILLRKELEAHGVIFSNKEWYEFELSFMEKHTYFTDTAKRTRQPVKDQNIEFIRNELKKLKNREDK